MAVDSRGSVKGQPVFDGNKASNTAADQNAIGDYAALVGNRICEISGKRTAFKASFGLGVDPWEGLEFFETDTGYAYRYTAGNWKEVDLDGSISPAGTVNLTPTSEFKTWLRLAHRNVSMLLAVDPGGNGLSASSTNALVCAIPPGFRPTAALIKRAEWCTGGNWAGTQQHARVRISPSGAVEVVYTTAAIPSGALLSLEASWPAA